MTPLCVLSAVATKHSGHTACFKQDTAKTRKTNHCQWRRAVGVGIQAVRAECEGVESSFRLLNKARVVDVTGVVLAWVTQYPWLARPNPADGWSNRSDQIRTSVSRVLRIAGGHGGCCASLHQRIPKRPTTGW